MAIQTPGGSQKVMDEVDSNHIYVCLRAEYDSTCLVPHITYVLQSNTPIIPIIV